MSYLTKNPKYQVEAWQWDGSFDASKYPQWVQKQFASKKIRFHRWFTHVTLALENADGTVLAEKGQYIVAYPSGQLGHMTAAVFADNFEKA